MQQATMSKIIPPPSPGEESKRQSVDLPVRLWEELDRVAHREAERRPERVTKTQTLQWLLEFALREYWAEQEHDPSERRRR